ncbi:hypothetical protein FM104_11080 [Microbacterium esteraromaticum]|uniref:DUF2029 domain-containing protein n=1 Tax=Microbacterium esteraromaticum TaxID=57043 RepID=A0A1R4K911_9MICO|nr:hypothetical protein [Microbacterium esteraromaticum]SJN40797.1 hypothetical protein FM104_11080 [Microbacterium esteraromaticum]
MRLARTIAFWLLAAGLLACHLVVIVHGFGARFWEDEAFNLTVPLNFLAGLGYSSDGALSGSVITPFDPRISTGPTVLVPVIGVLALGADPVIGARLVPVAFWAVLIVGLVLLGIRTAGRWVGLVAAAVPLCFNGLGSVSPIQGPADLLGEIPAAALLVWAVIVLRGRPWLAGLLVGLAVQAKLIALLALPAFAVALWLLTPGRARERIVGLWKRSWLPLILVGVPTLLFELAALLSMGMNGYIEHLRGMVHFVRGGGQHVAPTSVSQKLETLAGAWFVPAWVAVVTVIVCLSLAVAGLVVSRGATAVEADARARALLLAATAAVGALAFVGWWATASQLPLWVRHPAVGVLAFLPMLVIAAIWGARVLIDRGGAARIGGVLLMALLSLSLAWSLAGHAMQTTLPRSETLATQRAEIAPIKQWVEETGTAWLAAHPWGAAVAPVVLSGAHVGLADASSMADAPRLTGLACKTDVLIESGRYRVCAPPDAGS